MSDQLKELQEKYADQKKRASDLSRDLDASRREIKSLQDAAAAADRLEGELAAALAELKAANKANESLAKAADDAAVNTSAVEKQAAAFRAIRAAILETK